MRNNRKMPPGGSGRDLFPGHNVGAGKGDKPRFKLTDEWRSNFDSIIWSTEDYPAWEASFRTEGRKQVKTYPPRRLRLYEPINTTPTPTGAIDALMEYLNNSKSSTIQHAHARLKAQDLGLDIDSDEVIIALSNAGFGLICGSSELISKPDAALPREAHSAL